jgi:ribosomal protein S18 acetylase RimI-like enzyme
MQLIQASNQDLPRIVDIVNQAYRGAGWTSEAELISGPRVKLQTLEEIAGGTTTTVFAAKDAGSVLLGCVSLSPGIDGQWYLSMLAVNPAIQTAGTGKAIMAAAEEFASENGATSIKISVINHRDRLIAWYERRGYRKTGAVEPFPYNDPTVGKPLRDDLALITLTKLIAKL